MGFFDKKVSSTTNLEETNLTNVDNRVVENGGYASGAIHVTGSENVNVSTSDYGAIQAGSEVSMAALDYGADALETVESVTGNALDTNEAIAGRSIDLSGDTISTMADSFEFWSQQTSQNTDRALAFATRANTSEGTQVLQDGMKFISIAALVVGGTVVAATYFKGRK